MIRDELQAQFATAIRGMCLVLKPRKFDEYVLSGFWRGLHTRCTIEEVERAADEACQGEEWVPTPRSLFQMIESRRPVKVHVAPPPDERTPLDPEVRARMLETLAKCRLPEEDDDGEE